MRFLSPLMGVNFRPAEVRELVKNAEVFESFPLSLEREPDNQYDANAIRVLIEIPHDELTGETQKEFVGFVAKEVAEELAPLLDSAYEVESVEVIGWLGTIKPHLEIVVKVADEPKEYEDLDSTYEIDGGD